jgi:hypothetical protein
MCFFSILVEQPGGGRENAFALQSADISIKSKLVYTLQRVSHPGVLPAWMLLETLVRFR